MIKHRGGFVAIALSLLCASACSSPPPPPAGDTPDVALKKVLTSYVVEFLRRNPTTNTYLGGAGLDPSLRDVDGMLRDYSATALDDEDRWLGDTQAALEKIEAGGLATASRIDREVALAQIRFMLRQHQVRHYQQRALDTYVSEPFRALDWQLQGMTPTGGNLSAPRMNGRWSSIGFDRSRASWRPRRRKSKLGLKSGHVPDPRMLERDGLDIVGRQRQILRRDAAETGREPGERPRQGPHARGASRRSPARVRGLHRVPPLRRDDVLRQREAGEAEDGVCGRPLRHGRGGLRLGDARTTSESTRRRRSCSTKHGRSSRRRSSR